MIFIQRAACPCVVVGSVIAAALVIAVRPALADASGRPTQSLAGSWQFALDPRDEGVARRWFERPLADTIPLPGTTDEAKKGPGNENGDPLRLTRPWPYVGAAWYARELSLPAAWKGKRVVLRLERTKPSRLWVDGKASGERNSLVAPHEYVLGPLAPGRHRIVLRVDNGHLPPLGDPHQWSDHTQTNWNGVIGTIELAASDAVFLEDVDVYPDVAGRAARVRVEIGNATGRPARGSLVLSVSAGGPSSKPLRLAFEAATASTLVEGRLALGPAAATWDEFSPVLHTLAVELAAGPLRDHRTVSFGLREFRAQGTQFAINGRPTFLRGRHDACVFPLTGYPAMSVEGWQRVFETSKRYGLNHHRFHTWCPPEAAFSAADRLGVYLQPELPNWAAFGSPAHDDYLRAEGQWLLRAFGNHPSFVMLSLGNELGGSQQAMAPFVELFRRLDPRHLYAQGTNNWFADVDPGDDYWASFQVRGKKIRASFATVDQPLGHVQAGPASTAKDYAAEIAGIRVPVVSHEIGEYQSAPDLREIAKYTGVLRPRNLELLRQRLDDAGLLEQADDFARASGRLAVLCYREEIEAALRTRGFGGFQLLDLQDFPGQGTALVGILDAFLDSKGHVQPERWREFCGPTVPLARLPRFTWTTADTLEAAAELAHYGARDLVGATGAWTVRDASGAALGSGRLTPVNVAVGSVASLGAIRWPLADVSAPARLTVELAVEAVGVARVKSSWDVWVYPPVVDTTPRDVLVARRLDAATLQRLAAGGRVLLLPEPGMPTRAMTGSFAPDFWNWGMFRRFAEERGTAVAPGTLGILCDPASPALAAFPTQFHADWQWFELLKRSRPVVLDDLPRGYRPIVQAIDNYERAHRLGIVFELAVGPGRLLVSSIDLPALQERPEARQLLHSLLAYARSERFTPRTEVDARTLRRLLE